MSTAAAESSAALEHGERRGVHPFTLTIVGAAGIAAGLGGAVLIATSGHLLHPVAYGVELAILVGGTVAVALYWAVRRPGDRTAPILLILAAAYAGISLQGSADPVLHSVGVLFDPVIFVVAYYAVFAFPDGRLVGRPERVLIGASVVLVLTSFLPWFLFSPVVSGGAPLAGCNADCPHNALMIADRPHLANGFGKAEDIFAVVVTVAIAAGLVYRQATASRPRRRAFIPVYVPALMVTIPFAVFHAASAGIIDLGPDSAWTVGWFLTVGRTVLSFGFLLAIVQAAFFASSALKKIVGRVGSNTSALQLRGIVADALDDPTLELAFRVEGGFVDSAGDPIDPTSAAAGSTATAVDRAGETVAYIVHDPALNADPELVRSAGQSLVLALENGRLEGELRSTTSELRASRARIAAAGDAERRRIERDLHDGAQQHLIALRVKLALARELAPGDPEFARQLSALEDELDQVVDELRELAHGVYPSVLRDFGLVDGLSAVAQRSSPPASLDTNGIGRYAIESEAAVYFCCLEALQNVGKHAGAGAQARLRLWESGDGVCFEIADDGTGFDGGAVDGGGTGLTNMRDRVAALGGTLTIESASGLGTRVEGRVPRTRPA